MNLVSVILTVVIAAVTLMIGLVVFGNIESSMPTSGLSSNIINTMNTVTANTGTAFNFLALGLFIMAATFIIAIIAGSLGGGEMG